MMQEGKQVNIGDRPLKTRVGWMPTNMNALGKGMAKVEVLDVAKRTEDKLVPMLILVESRWRLT